MDKIAAPGYRSAWIYTSDPVRRELPENISAKAQRVLRLVGYDTSIYVMPPLPPLDDE